MARLCDRPGCSNPAEVSYGFDAEHLVVWLDAFAGPLGPRSGVLCLRHANAMVVPLGWMLDDRREPVPRLFKSPVSEDAPTRRRVRRSGRHHHDDTEQLLLDAAMVGAIPEDDELGVGVSEAAVELPAPASVDDAAVDQVVEDEADGDGLVATENVPAWQPLFDHQDDLQGLLATRSSLLSRAFHGTPRNA